MRVRRKVRQKIGSIQEFWKAILYCMWSSLFLLCKLKYYSVMPEPGGSGGPLPLPTIFFRSVNPIPTGEGRLSPTITTGTHKVFRLPASLHITRSWHPNNQNFEIYDFFFHEILFTYFFNFSNSILTEKIFLIDQ